MQVTFEIGDEVRFTDQRGERMQGRIVGREVVTADQRRGKPGERFWIAINPQVALDVHHDDVIGAVP